MRRCQHVLSFIFGFMVFITKDTRTTALLYPHESETREIKTLDGIWNFIKLNQTTPNQGILDKWYLNDLSKVSCVFFSICMLFLFYQCQNVVYEFSGKKQFRCKRRFRCPFRPVTMISLKIII